MSIDYTHRNRASASKVQINPRYADLVTTAPNKHVAPELPVPAPQGPICNHRFCNGTRQATHTVRFVYGPGSAQDHAFCTSHAWMAYQNDRYAATMIASVLPGALSRQAVGFGF